jgi:hypothetical protein
MAMASSCLVLTAILFGLETPFGTTIAQSIPPVITYPRTGASPQAHSGRFDASVIRLM